MITDILDSAWLAVSADMQPAYLTETGVRLWELTYVNNDPAFSTLSLLHASIADLQPLWHKLMADFVISFPVILHWRSLVHPIDDLSLFQQKKILTNLHNLPGKAKVINTNPDTGIISTVRCISDSWLNIEVDEVLPARYSTLVLSSNNLSSDLLWETMKLADQGINTHHVHHLLRTLDCVLARFIESDTHAVCQWIGPPPVINSLENFIGHPGIPRISASDVPYVIDAFR